MRKTVEKNNLRHHVMFGFAYFECCGPLLRGLSVSYGAIVKGLFVAYDPQVALIYDLRFPRIVIALLAGAGIAVSGVLFQAVLKTRFRILLL